MEKPTMGSKKFKQAVAVSYSIENRAHWPAKLSGVKFLCSVLKQALREAHPEAFKGGMK